MTYQCETRGDRIIVWFDGATETEDEVIFELTQDEAWALAQELKELGLTEGEHEGEE